MRCVEFLWISLAHRETEGALGYRTRVHEPRHSLRVDCLVDLHGGRINGMRKGVFPPGGLTSHSSPVPPTKFQGPLFPLPFCQPLHSLIAFPMNTSLPKNCTLQRLTTNLLGERQPLHEPLL